jgi:uncharacterized protein (DUF1330 family)
MLIVAKLVVRRTELAAFEEYETAAYRVIHEHGGALLQSVRIDDGTSDTLTEVHLVRFRDEAAFQAYRASTALAGVRHLRNASVVETELLIGEQGPDYGARP